MLVQHQLQSLYMLKFGQGSLPNDIGSCFPRIFVFMLICCSRMGQENGVASKLGETKQKLHSVKYILCILLNSYSLFAFLLTGQSPATFSLDEGILIILFCYF